MGGQRGGSAFFRVRQGRREAQEVEWTVLRDRWEYSPIARAVLVTTALALLVTSRQRLGSRPLRRIVLQPLLEAHRADARARAGDEARIVELGAEVTRMRVHDHFAV